MASGHDNDEALAPHEVVAIDYMRRLAAGRMLTRYHIYRPLLYFDKKHRNIYGGISPGSPHVLSVDSLDGALWSLRRHVSLASPYLNRKMLVIMLGLRRYMRERECRLSAWELMILLRYVRYIFIYTSANIRIHEPYFAGLKPGSLDGARIVGII